MKPAEKKPATGGEKLQGEALLWRYARQATTCRVARVVAGRSANPHRPALFIYIRLSALCVCILPFTYILSAQLYV